MIFTLSVLMLFQEISQIRTLKLFCVDISFSINIFIDELMYLTTVLTDELLLFHKNAQFSILDFIIEAIRIMIFIRKKTSWVLTVRFEFFVFVYVASRIDTFFNIAINVFFSTSSMSVVRFITVSPISIIFRTLLFIMHNVILRTEMRMEWWSIFRTEIVIELLLLEIFRLKWRRNLRDISVVISISLWDQFRSRNKPIEFFCNIGYHNILRQVVWVPMRSFNHWVIFLSICSPCAKDFTQMWIELIIFSNFFYEFTFSERENVK